MSKCHEVAGQFTCAEISERMEASNVPFALVVAPQDLPNDPHAVAIGLFEEFDHPVAGRIRQPRHPAQFLGTPAMLQTVSPTLGQQTDEILTELGRAESIEELRRNGIVF